MTNVQSLTHVRHILVPHLPYAGVGMLGKAIEVAFEVSFPLVVARLVDEALIPRDLKRALMYIALLAGFGCLAYMATLVCQYIAAQTSQNIARDIRHALFETLLHTREDTPLTLSASARLNTCIADTNQIQLACALAIRQLIRCPLLVLMSCGCACFINAHRAGIMISCIAVVGFVYYLCIHKLTGIFVRVQQTLDALSARAHQILHTQILIRMSRMEKEEQSAFVETCDDYARLFTRANRISQLLSPTTFIIMNVGMCLVLVASQTLRIAPTISQGQNVAFVNYMTQAMLAIVYIANLSVLLARAYTSATRVERVLEETSKKTGTEQLNYTAQSSCNNSPQSYLIRLTDVSFRYPPAHAPQSSDTKHVHASIEEHSALPQLSSVSLTLPTRGLIAITGGVGSGKSTLLKIIAQLIVPTSGSVLAGNLGDGVSRSGEPFTITPQTCCYIAQKPQLISGTIRDNVSLRYPDATDSEVISALRCACIEKEIERSAQGLSTRISFHTRQFSGGQIQRLCLARAFVRPCALTLLDDVMSSLDARTKTDIRAHISELAKQGCVVMVSQAIRDIYTADMIYLMDKGLIIAHGTHEELFETSQVYQEICQSQSFTDDALPSKTTSFHSHTSLETKRRLP